VKFRFWLFAVATGLPANVRYPVDGRKDSENAKRQQWVGFCRFTITAIWLFPITEGANNATFNKNSSQYGAVEQQKAHRPEAPA